MRKIVNGINQVKRIYDIRKKIEKLKVEESRLVEKATRHILIYDFLKAGKYIAELIVRKTRCPSWKNEFIKIMGIREAKKIIRRTTMSISEKLVVRKVG